MGATREGTDVVKAPGRDQREPMERLVRMAAVLRTAGDRGVAADRLADVAGFDGISRGDQLSREIRHLSRQGWQIDNIAPEGEQARYRMRAVDNRLRVRLSPAQQRALQRAAILADRDDLVERLGLPSSERPADVAAEVPRAGHDETLATVTTAVRHRSLLRYRYNGRERVVHPQSLRTQSGKWYLDGVEDGADQVKVFVVSRMSEVAVDAPGTATREPVTRHGGLHPMSWELDPPVDVTLRTTPQFVPDVRRWLGHPFAEEGDGETTTLYYRVTNRAALRTRLYELGRRVELLGPEDVRAEILDELATIAGRA